MTSAPRIWDLALQPERTALSWRRTTFSIAVGSGLLARVSAERLGPFGWVCAGTALIVALLVARLGSIRYRRSQIHLVADDRAPDLGRAAALVVAAVAFLGILVLVSAAVNWPTR